MSALDRGRAGWRSYRQLGKRTGGYTVELQPEWNEFLVLLSRHRVRFLLVGGHAVGVHGHERYTKDLDVLVEPSLANARRLGRARADFGFHATSRRWRWMTEPDRSPDQHQRRDVRGGVEASHRCPHTQPRYTRHRYSRAAGEQARDGSTRGCPRCDQARRSHSSCRPQSAHAPETNGAAQLQAGKPSSLRSIGRRLARASSPSLRWAGLT